MVYKKPDTSLLKETLDAYHCMSEEDVKALEALPSDLHEMVKRFAYWADQAYRIITAAQSIE